MLQEFLQEPPVYSLLQRCPPLFHTPSSFPFLFFNHYHPSMHVEDRSKDTMRDMYLIWVSVCMYVVPKGAGVGGGFTEGTGIRTGSTASKVQQRAVRGSRVVPSWQTASPLSPSLRGAWKGSHVGCCLQAVSQWAFLHWRLLCVLWETETDKQREGKRETDRDKWLITVIMVICFNVQSPLGLYMVY